MKKIGWIGLLLLILAAASPALAGKKEIKPCNIGVNPVGPAYSVPGEDLIETDMELVVVMGDKDKNIITCRLKKGERVVFKNNIATRIYSCSNPIYNRIVWKETPAPQQTPALQQIPAPQQIQKQIAPAPIQVPVKEELPPAIKQAMMEEQIPISRVAAKTGEKSCFGKSTKIIAGSSAIGGIGLAVLSKAHPLGWTLIALGGLGTIKGFSDNDSNLACEIAALPIGVAGGYGLGKLGEKIFETHQTHPSNPSTPSTGGGNGGGASPQPSAPTGPSTPPPAPFAPAPL